jgi:hypothetical protein
MMDSSNYFFVGGNGEEIRIVNYMPLGRPISAEQALNLAVWIAVLVDPSGERFEKLRKEVENL